MKLMRDKIFFDTNILVYAYEDNQSEKRRVCLDLVQGVFDTEIAGVISNQVLGEFSNIMVNKVDIGIAGAELTVKDLTDSKHWTKISYGPDTVKNALSTCRAYGIRFWDSVIVETMKENGITEIITENERDFGGVPGIKVTNPFKS